MHSMRHFTLTNQAGVTAGNADSGVFVGTVHEMQLFLNITALTGTTPSLTVYVDGAWDGNETQDGTKWHQLASFTAQTTITPNPSTAASGAATTQLPLGPNTGGPMFPERIRVRWTLTGTTPNATFTVEAVGQG